MTIDIVSIYNSECVKSRTLGTETTSKVDLKRENVWSTQGILGIEYSVSRFSIAAEYNVGEVSTFSLATGIRF